MAAGWTAAEPARRSEAALGYGPLLRRYLAGQRGAVAGMLLLLLLGIGLQLAGPQLVRRFIDAVGAGAPSAPRPATVLLSLWRPILDVAAYPIAHAKLVRRNNAVEPGLAPLYCWRHGSRAREEHDR